MPVYQIKELKRGAKQFGKNEQTGLFVKVAREDGTPLKQDVFFTEYHNAKAIQVCEQAGVNGWVDISWTRKGNNFYPIDAKAVKSAAKEETAQKDSAPAQDRDKGAEIVSLTKIQDISTRTVALDKAVTFVLGLIGTVIKPAKAEVGTLLPIIANTTKFFEGIIQGNEISDAGKSDASGLSKEPPPTKTPEVPDVPTDDGAEEPE